ncbi:MAG: hypothetical protein AAF639_04830 [Chloroflexota bacterium]
MDITKERLKVEIDYLPDAYVEIIYRILQAFIQVPHYQTDESKLNHMGGLQPVTLTLDDTFASIGPLPQPLDYKSMREIAFEDHAVSKQA